VTRLASPKAVVTEQDGRVGKRDAGSLVAIEITGAEGTQFANLKIKGALAPRIGIIQRIPRRAACGWQLV